MKSKDEKIMQEKLEREELGGKIHTMESDVSYRCIGEDFDEGVVACGFMRKRTRGRSQIDFQIGYYSGFFLLGGSGLYVMGDGREFPIRAGDFVQRLPGEMHSTYVEPDGEWLEFFVLDMVARKGVGDAVVYSSFSAKSMERIKALDKTAETGILDGKVSDCLYKLIGTGANALHPFWKGMDLPRERIAGYAVRAYFSGHLYPEKPTGTRLDLEGLEKQGITDVFLNEPEVYVE